MCHAVFAILQGIKFYDPEIVGDTPQAVESVGIRNVLDAVKAQLGVEAGIPLLRGDGVGQVRGGPRQFQRLPRR